MQYQPPAGNLPQPNMPPPIPLVNFRPPSRMPWVFVRFLQEKASVPADRLLASGYGEYQPIASNKTAAGRAKNRRIELLLTPSLAPKRISKAVLKDRHEAKKKQASAAKAGKRHH
jgi:hypothetical protein